MRNLRWITSLVIAAAVAVVGVAPVWSASNDVFAVEPSGPDGPGGRSFFIYDLAPGQIFQDTVAVSNFSDEELYLVLYSTDGFTIPRGGGFAPLREDETATGAGTWITMPLNEVTLEPGTRADIPFQIEIPRDATPGDHAAVIVASDPEGSVGEVEDGFSLTVRNRVGARVFVRVAGDLEPAVRVDSISVEYERSGNPLAGGRALITTEVTNTGNIRLSPDVGLEVTGLFGRRIATINGQEFQDLLPGSTVEVSREVDGLSPWEPLSARVLVDAREISTDASSRFVTIPWSTVLLLVLALALYVAWRWARRREERREKEDLVVPDMEEAES